MQSLSNSAPKSAATIYIAREEEEFKFSHWGLSGSALEHPNLLQTVSDIVNIAKLTSKQANVWIGMHIVAAE